MKSVPLWQARLTSDHGNDCPHLDRRPAHRLQYQASPDPIVDGVQAQYRDPVLDLFLSAFLDTSFVIAYCTFIFVVFSYSVLSIMRQKRLLADALNRVNQEWAKAPRKIDFVEHFEEYRGIIESQPTLQRAWHEFEETLVIPTTGGGEIRNTSDVSSYFNHTTVVSPNVSFNYYRSVPNLLTGLGILGTFLGLAAGVNAASRGLSSNTPEEITTSLYQLLQGSSLAFYTSITGILLSLIFVLINAHVSKHLDQVLAQMVDNIEANLTRVTTPSVALEQLREAKQTTLELKTFNTDLIFSIQQALEEKIANRLSPQLDELLKAVEGLRGDRATDSENVIANMIEHFSKALHDQAGNQFDQLGKTVGDLSDALESSTRSLTETQEKVRETLESNTTKVADSLAEVGKSLVSDVANQLQQALGGLGSATADQFGQMKSKLQDLNAVVDGLNTSLNESQTKMQTSIENSTTEMITAITAAAEETSQKLTSNVERSVGNLRSATMQLTEAMNATKSIVDEMKSFIDNFSELSKVIESTHDQISRTASPIKEGLLAVQKATLHHGELLRRSDNHLSEMRQLTVQLGQHGEAVQRTWEDYSDRFDGIDESLKGVFETLDEGLTRYCETIREFVEEIDSTAGNCISKLSLANSELTTVIEELGDTLKEHRR